MDERENESYFFSFLFEANLHRDNPELDPCLFPYIKLLFQKLSKNLSNENLCKASIIALELLLNQFSKYSDNMDLVLEAYEYILFFVVLNKNIPITKNNHIFMKSLVKNAAEKNIQLAWNLFDVLITLQDFIYPFVLSYKFEDFAIFLFTEDKYYSFAVKFIDNFCDLERPKKIYQNYNGILQKLMNYISGNKLNETKTYLFSKMLACLVYKFSNTTHILEDFSKINGIYNLFQKLNTYTESFKNVFYILIQSNDFQDTQVPNQPVGQFLSLQLMNSYTTPNVIKNILNMLSYLIVDEKFEIQKVNKYFNFVEIFKKTHLNTGEYKNELFNVFLSLIKIKYDSILNILMIILRKPNPDWNFVSENIQKMLDNNLIKGDLVHDLEHFFIEEKSTEELGNLLSRYLPLRNVFLFLYDFCVNLRPLFISKIIDIANYFKPIKSYLQFLLMLMKNLDFNELKLYFIRLPEVYTRELFAVVISLFVGNPRLISMFIEMNGFALLEPLFNRKDFSDQEVTNFVLVLASNSFNSKLNQMILQLNPNHRLFRLRQEYYQQIFAGNGKKEPFILPVLIPFLNDIPETNSQFDLVNLGKYSISMYDNLHKTPPNLSLIANRYITHKTVSYIMEKAENIINFVNLDFDHFPMYEFMPNKQNSFMLFNQKLYSISFWVKYVKKLDKPLTIFQSSTVSFNIFDEELTIKWGKLTEKVSNIGSNKWHFIFISSNTVSCKNENLNVIINQNKINFNENQEFNTIKFGDQQEYINSPWFISYNINYCPYLIRSCSFVTDIYKSGPGNILKSNKFTFFSPHLPNLQMGKFATLVPYRGLSCYLKIPKFLTKFFKMILDVKDPDKLYKLINFGFTFFEINHFEIPKFLDYFITIIKYHIKILSFVHYSLIFEFAFNKMPLKQLQKFINYLILDIEFWINMPKGIPNIVLNLIEQQITTKEKNILLFSKDTCPFFLALISTILPKYHLVEPFIVFLLNSTLKYELTDEINTIIVTLFSIPDQKVKYSIYKFNSEQRIFFLKELLKQKELLKPEFFDDEIIYNILNFGTSDELKLLLDIIFVLKYYHPKFEFFITLPIHNLINDYSIWLKLFSLLTMIEVKKPDSSLISNFGNSTIVYKNALTSVITLLFCGAITLIYGKSTHQKINSFLESAVKDGFCIIASMLQDASSELICSIETLNTVIIYTPLIISMMKKDLLNNLDLSSSLMKPPEIFDFSKKCNNICKGWNLTSKALTEKQKFVELPSDQISSFLLIINQLKECFNKFGLKPDYESKATTSEKLNFLYSIKYYLFISAFVARNTQQNSNIFESLLNGCLFFSPFLDKEIASEFVLKILFTILDMLSTKINKISPENIVCILGTIKNTLEIVPLPTSHVFPVFNFIIKVHNSFNQKLVTRSIRYLLFTILQNNDIESFLVLGCSIDIFADQNLNKKKDFTLYMFILLYPNILNFTPHLTLLFQLLYSNYFSQRYFIQYFAKATKFENCQKIFDSISFFIKEGKEVYRSKIIENVDKVYEELNKLIPTLQESFTKNLSEHFRQTPEMNNELFDKYCYSCIQHTKKLCLAKQCFLASDIFINTLLSYLIDFTISTALRRCEKHSIRAWSCDLDGFLSDASLFKNEHNLRVSPIACSLIPSRILTPNLFDKLNINENISKIVDLLSYPRTKTLSNSFPKVGNLNPSYYDSVIANFDTMNYYSFLNLYQKNNKLTTQFNSKFLRFSQSHECAIFIFEKNLYILLLAKIINENSLKLIDSQNKEYNDFLESLFLKEYDKYSFFCGHPVIHLKLSNVLNATINKSILHLVPNNCAEFSLDHPPNEIIHLFKESKNVIQEYSPKSNFLFKNLNLQDTIQEWLNGNISTFNFLIKLNFLDGRYSSNLTTDETGIIFPTLYTESFFHFHSIYPFNLMKDCFTYFSYPHFLIPELFKGDDLIQVIVENCDELEKSQTNVHRWVSTNFSSLLQNKKLPANKLYKKPIIKMYPEEKLETHLCNFRAKIVPNSSVLYFQTNNKIKILNDPNYISSTSISSTFDGNYIVIDYEYGVSTAYKVIYKKGKPKRLSFINDFITEVDAISSINGKDFICSTCLKNKIFIWDFIRAIIIQTLEFPEDIKGTTFDEDNGFLWCWSETTLYLNSVNGTIILKTSPPDGIIRAYGAYDKSITLIGNGGVEGIAFYGQSSHTIMLKPL